MLPAALDAIADGVAGPAELPWGMLSAGGILSIIPLILLFALVQRAMVAGLTGGAVKA